LAIGNTFCATYDNNYTFINNSCITNYDFQNNFAICTCFYEGLTTTIINKQLAKSILQFQFDSLALSAYNMVTLYVFISLSFSLSFCLLVAWNLDSSQAMYYPQQGNKNIDMIQKSIVEYNQIGFNEN